MVDLVAIITIAYELLSLSIKSFTFNNSIDQDSYKTYGCETHNRI